VRRYNTKTPFVKPCLQIILTRDDNHDLFHSYPRILLITWNGIAKRFYTKGARTQNLGPVDFIARDHSGFGDGMGAD